jgi:hypothetical protein
MLKRLHQFYQLVQLVFYSCHARFELRRPMHVRGKFQMDVVDLHSDERDRGAVGYHLGCHVL